MAEDDNFYLLAFVEGSQHGNVWQEGNAEMVVATARDVFGAYGVTEDKLGALLHGERIYLSENPYGADYIQAVRRHHQN